MKKLEDYTPSELATLATVLGMILASKFNVNQQNVVANFLFGVAQSIFIIAAQIQNLKAVEEEQSASKASATSNGTSEDMQKQINELKEHIKKFEDKMNC